ncbi:MAG: C40 family peptidase [Xanthomonadaceae bacterium]|nr:C40 family peptidase [Xanthomonadaceae bacterium]
MPIKRLTVVAALLSVLLLSAPVYAGNTPTGNASVAGSSAVADAAARVMRQMPSLNPLPTLGQSVVPGDMNSLFVAAAAAPAAGESTTGQADSAAPAPAAIGSENITDLRKALLAAAMSLRDVRYVRGGHDPSTGFDCSGFVRYVFSHAIGLQLPSNSASQFLAGLKVKRADMKPGDLVFFRTRGRHRISHVGIYIANGRFIHSPTTGKSVEISSLDDGYWAKRFAGAKRPEAMALAARRG